MRRGATASVRFAGRSLARLPVYFPTPGVHEPDALFEATVGLPLLRHSVLTLDFHDDLCPIA